ncbi:MAG TPA: hypothetical protein VFQ38_04340 [Longimicrobiales bacterium]|nr:hypothetical protein [Longimicrobiales bacterium]
MLVRCSFEELAALTAGAERTVQTATLGGAGVVAPPQELVDVEALLPRLSGDLDVRTLAEQRSLRRAVDLILETLRARMDETILEQYVGAEDAVVAYFDYAHVLTIRERIRRVGKEMEALIELITGAPASDDSARQVTFPE